MPEPRPIHLVFNSVDPGTPEHALPDDTVASATNVDFGLGQGFLRPRRGSTLFGTVGTSSIGQIFRNNNAGNDIFAGQFYVSDAAGKVYRGSGGTWTAILTGAQPGLNGINAFGTYALIAGNGKSVKDDGTLTTDWIKQVPDAPVVAVTTLSAISFSTSSYAVIEGTAVGTATQTITVGATTDGRVVVGLQFVAGTATAGKDLTVNGTNTIGDFGVHFVDLAFDNPSSVLRIAQDWSVGDATFHNYWHAELFPQNAVVPFVDGKPSLASAQPDPNALIDSQLSVGTSSNNVDQATREQMLTAIRSYNRTSAAVVSRIANVLSPWAVARPDLQFVGTYTGTSGADAWANIYAVRFTIEMDSVGTCTLANVGINGAQNFPLTDTDVGYAYWQTFATLDTSGIKVGESGPSASSPRVRMQNAQATVATTHTATGTAHGITHIITYRQGGYMRDAYAVATASLAVTTITDTQNDIQVLSLANVMPRNIMSPGRFAGAIQCVSAPWNERVFVGCGGTPTIIWSLPGQIDTFPTTSTANVSHTGDNVKAMIPWPPGLTIVNAYSVYEMQGSDFENGQWTLSRSGSRHGSIAPRVPIATPYGIPLLNWDGLTMYVPGQGSDQEIDWLNARYGDMFLFEGTSEPAGQKGNRIPAINRGYFDQSVACYGEGRLLLAAPTGTDTSPRTVYVIDFPQKRCWWYSYPFAITAMYWDYISSRFFAGTDDGRIMEIETGQFDTLTNGTTTGIPWSARTKRFSAAADTMLENVFVECSSPNNEVTLTASFDGAASALTTFSGATRAWHNAALNGTFANSLEFLIAGTSAAPPFINGITFDLMAEPYRAKFFRSPYDEHQYTADKLWDVAYYDVAARTGTGTLTAVTFVDNTAVMTASIVGPVGRSVTELAFPLEQYGRIAYTTYTSAIDFQVFDTRYDARNEPAKISSFKSDVVSLEENICDALDIDAHPNGTITATTFIDNVAIQTNTFVASARQSFTIAFPREQYGRTLFVYFSGSGFKLYKNWFHLRPEPDRWLSFVSSKQSGDEHEWKVFKPEVNPLGGTILATVTNEGTAIGTYTLTGSQRLQYTFSLPIRTFGRTIWAGYSGTSVFKHYTTEFEGDAEPPRVTQYRTGPYPFPSTHDLKTWLPLLDVRAGTVTGTLIVDDVATTTVSFTGDRRQWYTVGLDLDGTNAIETGSRWEAIYSAAAPFKHYQTKLESESRPFGKKVWAYSYRKQGGASQLDMPRFASIDAEAAGTASCTYFLDIDGTVFTTGTLTLTGGIQWIDRIALPPGGRGRIFEFRLQCGSNNVKVGKVNLDFLQEGIKALTRREQPGTPGPELTD